MKSVHVWITKKLGTSRKWKEEKEDGDEKRRKKEKRRGERPPVFLCVAPAAPTCTYTHLLLRQYKNRYTKNFLPRWIEGKKYGSVVPASGESQERERKKPTNAHNLPCAQDFISIPPELNRAQKLLLTDWARIEVTRWLLLSFFFFIILFGDYKTIKCLWKWRSISFPFSRRLLFDEAINSDQSLSPLLQSPYTFLLLLLGREMRTEAAAGERTLKFGTGFCTRGESRGVKRKKTQSGYPAHADSSDCITGIRHFFFRACVRVSHAIHRCIMLIPAGLTDWKLNVRLFWRIDKQSGNRSGRQW